MKTFVIGDIHGQYEALVGCLKACGFDYDNDRLIALGDVCDRGPQVKECIDELLKIRHLVYILGNHDAWALEWAMHGRVSEDWLREGGSETMLSYQGIGMPKEHIQLLAKALLYFEEAGRLFVHAGFDVDRGVKGTPSEMFIWDRGLIASAEELHATGPGWKFRGYDEIFIGHTPDVLNVDYGPRHLCNIWAMDTGAGYGHKLSIMDVETKQYWQPA